MKTRDRRVRASVALRLVTLATGLEGCRRDHDGARQDAQMEAPAPTTTRPALGLASGRGDEDAAATRRGVPELPFERLASNTGAASRWNGDEPGIRVGPEGVFLRTGRGLERLPAEGGDATVVIEDTHVDAFERDDENLYWIHLSKDESWDLMRADVSGHHVERLGRGPGAPPVPLAIDEDRIYVGGPCAAQTIYGVAKEGGELERRRAPCEASSFDGSRRYADLSARRGALAWIVHSDGRGPCLRLLVPASAHRDLRCMPFDAVTVSATSFYSTSGADFGSTGRGVLFRWDETHAESPDVLSFAPRNRYVHQVAVDGDDVYLAVLPDEPSAGEIWRVHVPSRCAVFLANVPLATRIAARDGQVFALLASGDLYRAPRAPFAGCQPSRRADSLRPGEGGKP